MYLSGGNSTRGFHAHLCKVLIRYSAWFNIATSKFEVELLNSDTRTTLAVKSQFPGFVFFLDQLL